MSDRKVPSELRQQPLSDTQREIVRMGRELDQKIAFLVERFEPFVREVYTPVLETQYHKDFTGEEAEQNAAGFAVLETLFASGTAKKLLEGDSAPTEEVLERFCAEEVDPLEKFLMSGSSGDPNTDRVLQDVKARHLEEIRKGPSEEELAQWAAEDCEEHTARLVSWWLAVLANTAENEKVPTLHLSRLDDAMLPVGYTFGQTKQGKHFLRLSPAFDEPTSLIVLRKVRASLPAGSKLPSEAENALHTLGIVIEP